VADLLRHPGDPAALAPTTDRTALDSVRPRRVGGHDDVERGRVRTLPKSAAGGGIVSAVLIYDAVWFALPIAALAMCSIKPDAAQAVVVSTHRWTGKHARTLVVVTSFVVGVALVVRGVLAL
jgi:hypothetical protein